MRLSFYKRLVQMADMGVSSPAKVSSRCGPTINDLPDELLLEIFSSIPSNETSTLYNLALTSRKYNKISEPFLYHTFQYDAAVHAPVRLFISTLLIRPELASHVKEIFLSDWDLPNFAWEASEIASSRQVMLEKVGQFNFPPKYTKRWKQTLADGEDHAEIALLLFLVPNLEILSLQMPHKFNPKHFMPLRLLFEALDDPDMVRVHQFAKLRKLLLAPVEIDGVDPLTIAPFSTFFRLPAMEEFQADQGYDIGSMHLYEWPIHESTVRTIVLRDCYSSGHAVATLIHACKSLRTFQFIWNGNVGHSAERMTDFSEAFSAFLTHETNLENLSISINRGHRWGVGPHNSATFYNIHKFAKLTTLHISPELLIGFLHTTSTRQFVDLFPASLEALTLNIWAIHTNRDINVLAEHSNLSVSHASSLLEPPYLPLLFNHLTCLAQNTDRFPTLKRIVINSFDTLREQWQPVVDEFGRVGISVEVCLFEGYE
ncbi:hypothetical protein K432DRAFT_334052 [Lepidopterella palustris CBS 459.81]|uniref:F-box domain-containing protein n=1 Tax=Lepidopterella palustris CBS 459.81 TaxID=1314670 RepID=A0A8E2E507_9PEZI|nr:hypothetical protein K432DRAFT_334052 [Lepidopterella palustris CBS 459.81]